MTQEQKAKRFDEVLEQLKGLIEGTREDKCAIVEEDIIGIFPELKESEDERIRKAIITFFESEDDNTTYALVPKKDILAWLEKQGEQKPAEKIEPKFQHGQWIVWQNKCYKVNYNGCGYELIDQNGLSTSLEYGTIDENAHLWDITKDAKDGDVLYHSDTASNGIFIFKELLKYEFGEKVICYCDYDSEDHFCLGEHHTCCWADAKILHPATKEQRDLLFAKMHEAGYEWDGGKGLRKIEQKLSNSAKIGMDEESKWTEEDEQYLLVCKNALHKYQWSDKWDADIISKWLEDKLKYRYNRNQVRP